MQRKLEHLTNPCISWFTAWDPGGIEDIGDAMLYNLFSDIVADNQDLTGAFDKLKEALGLRKSVKHRIGEALGAVSKAAPGPAGPIADAASNLLLEFDTPREIRDSFQDLLKWLEEHDRYVFLFIDDIDRATGEQIRVLLSALKVYVSHRRIVGIVGYDQDYVLNALQSVLPSGIDPKRFLEKIVTIRKALPIPTTTQLATCAVGLLGNLSTLDNDTCTTLARYATSLSLGNPRRLKTLVLVFTDLIASPYCAEFSVNDFVSALLVCDAEQTGLLADDQLQRAFEGGSEEEISQVLLEIGKKMPERAMDAERLGEILDEILPDFRPNLVSRLRLIQNPPGEAAKREESSRSAPKFDWRIALSPILSAAAKRGF